MRSRALIWLGLGLLLLAGGLLWWRGTDRSPAGIPPAPTASAPAETGARLTHRGATNQVAVTESATPFVPGAKSSATAPSKKDPLAYRLTNSTKPAKQLRQDDHVIDLENALIDTTRPRDFKLPESLRLVGDPGSYIVQARGPVDDAFRAALTAAGVELVSYIPNNAWLVRASAAAADRLSANPRTQAVLPWEPVYKLKAELLGLALEEKPLPLGAKLNVLVFANARAEVLAQLEKSQMKPLAEERSPFGAVFTVEAGSDWVALARLPGVQIMERAYPRARANDQSRVRVGVAADSVTQTNYLGLTGSNILVSINDSGVDATHPDLLNRVFANNAGALVDNNGHGTHVGGILIGNGAKSLTVSNAQGSINPATTNQYRGMAPGAKLFVQNIGVGLGSTADVTLQENAALTNVFISNNSWGYIGDSSYSLASASYDASTRDALSGLTGSQPQLYVFAAGNGAGGNDDGTGGQPGSVYSPGTAKNVIAVGAIELARNITNEVEKITGGVTNKTVYWQEMTSSGNQVAAFSGRGNVGIGVEGDFGRFKPDVVAPGTFVISTRSSTWDEKAYYNPTNHEYLTLRNEVVNTNDLNSYGLFLPENCVGFTITIYANEDSPVPFPDLPIFVRRNGEATATNYDLLVTNSVSVPPSLGGVGTAVGQEWSFSVGNPTDAAVSYNIFADIISTNDLGNYYQVLSNLNNSITSTNLTGPHYYRYESGTSMAAPSVSGTLALMQEFFEQRLGATNSPALMKALLINGARSVGNLYDFQVQNTINYQGWGLVKLNNSLPPGISNAFKLAPSDTGSIKLIDQSPTNALATGQSFTRFITLDDAGRTLPLRVTLAWTDPPGNPAAGVKLVNDLDLVVTNYDDPADPIVYFGNDIPSSSRINFPWDTNAPPNYDSVNNIENVFLSPALGTNYSITVRARRVNVNAITANTNGIVQDYALVISCGNGEATNGITVLPTVQAAIELSPVTFVTNSIVQPNDFAAAFLENQRVGANPSMLSSTNGITNQWKFYVVTNATTFTNAAILISQHTDLATPRLGVFAGSTDESTRRYADLDLYVSKDAALTNLDPVVVAASFQSRSRNDVSGDEVIIFTNSAAGDVYYVGVKSEDQMAGQFEFFSIFSLNPLGAEDAGGFVRGYPMSGYLIPDGSPSRPGGTRFVAITRASLTTGNETIRRVILTNNVTHEHYGDIIATVDHNSRVVAYDNKRELETPPYPAPPGPYRFLYDDSGEGDFLNAIPPDGPGTFESYVGEVPGGTWYFTYSDDALTQTGRVNDVRIRVERQPEDDAITTNVVAALSWKYFSRNVPVEATNLTIIISNLTVAPNTPGPLELYVRRGARPSRTVYDYTMTINPPGGSLTIDKSDLPPLTAGRYFIGVYNGNPDAQTFSYQSIVLLGPPPGTTSFGSVGSTPLLDDAVTNYTVFITNTAPISQLDVALRIDHPRVSDLAVTLVSPRGTRVLLAENRGGTNVDGFGGSLTVTNFTPVAANGGQAGQTNFIETSSTVGTVTIDYDFFNVPDQMTVYYDGAPIPLFDSGMTNGARKVTLSYGPGISTQLEVRMNEFGNTNSGTSWEYSVSSFNTANSYLIFTDNTNKTTTPIKFAAPPFRGTPGSVTNISDFEAPVLAQDYVAPQTGAPDGWDVLTNTVTVITNTAFTGTNSLALRSGVMQRTFPTIVGRTYQLGYAYRKAPSLDGLVAWWKADSDTVDSINGNNGTIQGGMGYGVGEVGQAFNVVDNNDGVFVPASPSLAVTNLTLEAWIFPTDTTTLHPIVEYAIPTGETKVHFLYNWDGGDSPGALFGAFRTPTGTLVVATPAGTCPPNQWSHVALTFDYTTRTAQLYRNGAQVGTATFPTPITPQTAVPFYIGYRSNTSGELGASARFAGRIDEIGIFNRALNASELTSIFAVGAAGKCGMPIPPGICSTPLGAVISIPGQATNSFLGTATWQLGGLIFTATNTNTLVNLAPLNPSAPSGVLVDSFTLTEQASARYVLPEESLKAFEGENPFGLWKLEILDNRTGANINVTLLDWQLQFLFQDNTPLPGSLPPGVTQTNTIPAGGIKYYIVDVPAWAKFATNDLIFATGPVNVLFNQNTPPAIGATNVGDVLFFGPALTGSYTMNTVGPPPLLPGQRYYLGVHNPNTSNVTVAVQVSYDITALANGVPINSTLGTGPLPRYFYYDITTNATAVSFRLFGLNGNVDLVARRGAPLPTQVSYDYGSFNPGNNNEDIVLLTNSTPVPLTPGRWYLGVFNPDVAPVTYNIVANEFTNVFPKLITLTNAIPYANTNSGTGGGADYYRFVVSPGSVRAQFEINSPSDDVTLVARKGIPLPDLGLYDYVSANAYTNDELIVVLTNSSPVNLSPGDWFLTAVNLAGVPVSYSIKATEWPAAQVPPFIITSVTLVSNEFCLTWNSVPGAYYFVQGLTNFSGTNWTRVSPQIVAVDTATTWCITLPSPYHFFRVSEGLALSTYVPPPKIQSLTVGTNGVTLRWNGPATASYNVEWTPTIVPPAWTNFSNTITSPTGLFQFLDDGTQTGGFGPMRFYRLLLLP